MFLIWVNAPAILLSLLFYWLLTNLINKHLLADVSVLYKFKYFYLPFVLLLVNFFAVFFFKEDFIYYLVLLVYIGIPFSVILKQRYIDSKDEKISREIYNLTTPLIFEALKRINISSQKIIVVAKKRKEKIDGEIIVKLPEKTLELENIKEVLQNAVREKSKSNLKLIFDYKFNPRKKKSNGKYSPAY